MCWLNAELWMDDIFQVSNIYSIYKLEKAWWPEEQQDFRPARVRLALKKQSHFVTAGQPCGDLEFSPARTQPAFADKTFWIAHN